MVVLPAASSPTCRSTTSAYVLLFCQQLAAMAQRAPSGSSSPSWL
jgi:hypothetical protein